MSIFSPFRKRLFIGLFGVNLALALFLGGRNLVIRARQRAVLRREIAHMAKEWKDTRVLSSEVADRWGSILFVARDSGTISDKDLDWLLPRYQGDGTDRNAPPDTLQQDTLVRAEMNDVLQQVRYPTPAQRERIFQATCTLLKNANRSDPFECDELEAIKEFRHLGDPRAVDILTPYLSDPRSDVRAVAEYTVQRLGHQLTSSQKDDMADFSFPA